MKLPQLIGDIILGQCEAVVKPYGNSVGRGQPPHLPASEVEHHWDTAYLSA